MRFALLLAALALALPAEAQERFYQSCVAAAGSDMPDGIGADAMCGCAVQQSVRLGAEAAALDRLADHVPAGGESSLDMASLPSDLQPVAEIMLQSMVGCAFQLGLAEMMSDASLAPPAEEGAEAPTGLPAELAGLLPTTMAGATGSAEGPGTAAADGTPGADAEGPRPIRPAPAGFRTGAGTPPVRAVRISRGAAIRILE